MTNTTTSTVTALLDGVTEGPWRYDPEDELVIYSSLWAVCSVVFNARVNEGDSPLCGEANARFIAAARQLVPALLAERDAAIARADGLQATIEQMQGPLSIAALTARAESAEADAAKARRFRDIARDEVKEWHEVAVSHAARVAELEAALPRAWERGRDAAAREILGKAPLSEETIMGLGAAQIMHNLLTVTRSRAFHDASNCIRALTPPADLCVSARSRPDQETPADLAANTGDN